MSYADLELNVVRWAEARGIVQNSNPAAQARKTLEEAGELLEAAARMQVAFDIQNIIDHNEKRAEGSVHLMHKLYREQYRDALGDVLVTLIVGAATADVDLMSCLSQAYEEIKDRKGYLRPDGVFVKEA